MRFRAAISIFGVVAAAGTAMAQPAIFQILPGSVAEDVSADGSVVVGYYGSQRAFRWTEATGRVDLGAGVATGVSADGQTVAGFSGTTLFRWTSGAGRQDATGAGNVAKVSADGSTIVSLTGWRWRGDSLARLPGVAGYAISSTTGINADGSVIVGATYTANGLEPAIWNGTGSPQPLGRIPGGRYDGEAGVVSGDGATVYGIARGPAGYDAFRWTAPTGMVGLNFATNGFIGLPVAKDGTPDGSIIVGEDFGEAIVWTPGAGPQYLQDVLTRDYGINLGDLNLHTALGISDDGKVVVGYADSPSGFVAWRVQLPWSVPAPGIVVPFAAIAFGALARRRRAR